jgi:hypothetical protein
MHSAGSVRLSMSDAMGRLCESNDVKPNAEPPSLSEMQEDVVVIQEEEIVLVHKELPASSPVQEATVATSVEEVQNVEPVEPKCIEPDSTMSAPPSKPKPKKKHQKRR